MSGIGGAPSGKTVPRGLAVRILTRVLSDGEPLDEALERLATEARLAPLERAWLLDVCSGTLRWKGRLDQAIDAVAIKKKPSGWLRKILLTATYQLIAQDRSLPAIVVSETVNEVRGKEGEAPARFANALLRKIADHRETYRALAFPADETAAAGWASLPPWLWHRLIADHGLDWARSYALASFERPVTWVRIREGIEPGEWVGKPGPVPGAFEAKTSGLIPEKAGFSQGDFFVQDISSQRLVSEISDLVRAAGITQPNALDLCAAPGGKAAGLAWNGFSVVATDRPDLGEERFGMLRETLERVAPEATRVIPRAEVAELPAQDLVWVDAPCTGTGILRRHPDVRWLRQERELAPLEALQQKLLAEGYEKVRPGGFLAYSVCSVLTEEGRDAIRKSGFAKDIVKEWFLVPQEAPHGDGFWACLLRKAGDSGTN